MDLYWTTAQLFMSPEFHLAQLFKIPYKQIMEIVYAMSKDIHVSWQDFNEMPFFEILMLIDEHNEFVEKQESDSSDQTDIISQQQAQMQQMYNQQQQMMPKYEAPKFDMPKMPTFN